MCNFYFILYIVIGLITLYFMWSKYYNRINAFLSKDDYEKTMILYYFFGIIIWPLFLIEFIRQNK